MYSIVCITCYTCMIDIHASQRKSRGTGDGGLSRVMLQCYVMICVCYSGFPSGIIRSNGNDAENVSMAPAQG